MMRRYGAWSGCPKGTPEDKTLCVAEVAYGGRSCLFHQCNKKRGKGVRGDLCGTHARIEAQGGHVSIPDDSKEAIA